MALLNNWSPRTEAAADQRQRGVAAPATPSSPSFMKLEVGGWLPHSLVGSVLGALLRRAGAEGVLEPAVLAGW